MSQDKIIDKIVKLLKLSEGKNANEHEAANAAARAAEMMSQHDLDEASIRVQIKEQSGEAKPAEPIEQGNVEGRSYKRIETWRGILAGGIADGFGCHMWWSYGVDPDTKQRVVRIRLLGRKSHVQTVSYMFAYLEKELERLAQEAWQAEVPKPLAAAAVAWRNSFLLGASQVVANRLHEQRRQQFKPPTGTAIVVRDGERVFNAAPPNAQDQSKALVLIRQDQAEVDVAYKDTKKKLGLRSGGSYSGPSRMDAYSQGKAAGHSVNLSTGRPGIGAAPKQIK